MPFEIGDDSGMADTSKRRIEPLTPNAPSRLLVLLVLAPGAGTMPNEVPSKYKYLLVRILRMKQLWRAICQVTWKYSVCLVYSSCELEIATCHYTRHGYGTRANLSDVWGLALDGAWLLTSLNGARGSCEDRQNERIKAAVKDDRAGGHLRSLDLKEPTAVFRA
ncbi:hypothetical protein GGI43DRAFT_384637 [Trichoderma evansii]